MSILLQIYIYVKSAFIECICVYVSALVLFFSDLKVQGVRLGVAEIPISSALVLYQVAIMLLIIIIYVSVHGYIYNCILYAWFPF